MYNDCQQKVRKSEFIYYDSDFFSQIREIKCRQPYHPAAQDRLPTEAKQGWAWSVPGWETFWEN